MKRGIRAELKRKALHLTGLVVPTFYLILGREFTLYFVAVAFVTFVVLEPFRIIEGLRDAIKVRLRIINPDVASSVEAIERHIHDIERPHEREGVAAHIYFTLASLVIVYFFSSRIAVASISVATVGDALAAIVGKNLGRHRFSNGKSVEGSLAYFVSGFLIIYSLLGPFAALAGSLAGTVAEFFNLPPDDNFSNQLTVAITLYLLPFLAV